MALLTGWFGGPFKRTKWKKTRKQFHGVGWFRVPTEGGGEKLIETLLKSSFTFILTMPFELGQNMFYLKWKKPQCYMTDSKNLVVFKNRKN